MQTSPAMREVIMLCQALSFPALAQDDFPLLMRKAQRADVAGRAPSDPDWEPTYNIAAAVALGWQLKAGKAAGLNDYQTAEQRQAESQIIANCLRMAREWKRKANSTVSVFPRRQTAPVDYYDNVDLIK